MAKKNISIHVVPRSDGWVVRKADSSRATSTHKTQRDAVEAAREIARNQSSELIIHGRDGRIRDRDSYGHDPMPPKDDKDRPSVLYPEVSPSVSKKDIHDAVTAVVRESKSSSPKRSSNSTSRG
jgi:hypothetical protein